MDLNNKLKGLPPIYYVNLDFRTDRREHMEAEFKKWNITNYTRVSASRFSIDKIDDWKHKLDLMLLTPSDASIVLNQFNTIIDWYNSGVSEYCIIMQDDLSLELIEYWNFDWEYLMNNLPYNWDCIQLYFCNWEYIPMHLRKRLPNTSSGACYMVNRFYAEKLIKIHQRPDGGFKLANNLKDVKIPKECYSSDDFLIYQIGVTYTLPILSLDQKLSQNPDNKPSTAGDNVDSKVSVYHNKIYDIVASHLIKKWWKEESKNYTVEDFFSYGKSTDAKMTIKIPDYNKKIYAK